MRNESKINRRQFMSIFTGIVASVIGVGMAIPALAYIIGPSFRRKEENWIKVGSTTKVVLGTPTLFKAKITRQDGWIASDEEISTYLLTDDGQTFIALSSICTHLGCRIRWNDEREQFHCPCHVGIFDRQGNVVSGPPPRPLDRYRTMINGEEIFILVA